MRTKVWGQSGEYEQNGEGGVGVGGVGVGEVGKQKLNYNKASRL